MRVLVLTSEKSASTHSPKFLRQIEYLNSFDNITVDLKRDIDLIDLDEIILSNNYDCIFPTSVFQYIEGTNVIEKFNQDLYKLLNYRKQPYIGSDFLTHLLLNDKALSNIKSGIGLENLIITRKMWNKKQNHCIKLINDFVKFKVIVKPNTLAASLGIDEKSICSDIQQITEKISSTFRQFEQLSEILIERFIENAVEYAVSVTGNGNKRIVNVTKLISKTDKKEIFSFENKNASNKMRTIKYITEQNITKVRHLKSEALRLSNIFNISDIGRFDFLMDENKVIYLIDANSMPFLGNNYFYYYTNKKILREEQVFGLVFIAFSIREKFEISKDLIKEYPNQLLSKLL